MGMKKGKKNRTDATNKSKKREELVFLDFDADDRDFPDTDLEVLSEETMAAGEEVAQDIEAGDEEIVFETDIPDEENEFDPDETDDTDENNEFDPDETDDTDEENEFDPDEADDENAVEKKKTMALYLGMILGILIMLGSGVMLLTTFLQYRKADQIYADSREEYISVNSVVDLQLQTFDETNLPAEEGNYDAPLFDDSNAWYRLVDVDMDALTAVNPDIVGWLHFENMDISYPVLRADDNDTYLHTSYDGTSLRAGSIFMDCNNTGDFRDSHTILYGHNMKNGSMFGKLKEYREISFYQGHEYFQIITRDYIYRYMIFAYEDIPDTSFVYQVPFGRSPEFEEFLDEIRKISMISPDISVSREDMVITLSTCSTSGRRFVVHGVRIGEYNRPLQN